MFFYVKIENDIVTGMQQSSNQIESEKLEEVSETDYNNINLGWIKKGETYSPPSKIKATIYSEMPQITLADIYELLVKIENKMK